MEEREHRSPRLSRVTVDPLTLFVGMPLLPCLSFLCFQILNEDPYMWLRLAPEEIEWMSQVRGVAGCAAVA